MIFFINFYAFCVIFRGFIFQISVAFRHPKTNQPEMLDEAFGMLRNQAENATVSRRLCVILVQTQPVDFGIDISEAACALCASTCHARNMLINSRPPSIAGNPHGRAIRRCHQRPEKSLRATNEPTNRYGSSRSEWSRFLCTFSSTSKSNTRNQSQSGFQRFITP